MSEAPRTPHSSTKHYSPHTRTQSPTLQEWSSLSSSAFHKWSCSTWYTPDNFPYDYNKSPNTSNTWSWYRRSRRRWCSFNWSSCWWWIGARSPSFWSLSSSGREWIRVFSVCPLNRMSILGLIGGLRLPAKYRCRFICSSRSSARSERIPPYIREISYLKENLLCAHVSHRLD